MSCLLGNAGIARAGHQRVRVGALVPTFTITTIELRITALQARAYYKVHDKCATHLTYGGTREHQDEYGHGRIDAFRHRRLWMSTLISTLDAAPARITVKKFTRYFSKYADWGMSMLFKMLAQTMINHSPKLV